MKKNTASQTVSFKALDTASTRGAITVGVPTVYVSKDGGAQATSTNSATHDGNGQWTLTLTQTETNADHIALTFVLTGAVNDYKSFYTSSTVDVIELGGDATAGTNLRSQYDETGLSGDQFPATQAQVSNIASTGAALNTTSASYTLTTGVQSSGTISDTETANQVYHEHTDSAGSMELYYEFDVGADGVGVEMEFRGRLNGGNDDMFIEAYDWVSETWKELFNLGGKNGTTDDFIIEPLFSNYTGTGANSGTVRIRFVDQGANLTTATLRVDQLFVSYSVVNRSAGYLEGAVWIDTNGGASGTTPYVNGTADNPVGTLADAETLTGLVNLKKFHLLKGSFITLDQAFDRYIFNGNGGQIDFNGQVLNFCTIEGHNLSGAIAGTGRTFMRNCRINSLEFTAQGMGCQTCSFNGDILLAPSVDYSLLNCYSTASSLGCTFDFQLHGNTEMNMQGYTGDFNVSRMAPGDVLHVGFGGGDITIDADCTGGVVDLHGTWNVTDLSGGAVTINDDSNINCVNIEDCVWEASQSDHTTVDTFGEYLDSKVSEAGGSGLTEAGIADEVWDRLGSSHSIVGSFGYYLDARVSQVSGGGGGDLVGPYSVTITVRDTAENPIENALVRMSRTGETGTLQTDANGEATFTVSAATWDVLIDAASYEGQTNELIVGDDLISIYNLNSTSLPQPSNPLLCAVTAFVYLNGRPLENAEVRARIVSNNSSVDGIVLSTAKDTDKTDIEGIAVLELVRQDQFAEGNGIYIIEAWHDGKKLWDVTTTIPNASTANLEDLV